MEYTEVFSRLTYETATILFFKKDGKVRIMLATRNLHTAELLYGFLGGQLGGHDTRCNINNGNVAVIDLIIGEGRSFNIDRLISIEYHGQIESKEQLEDIIEKYQEFKHNYEQTQPMQLTMDMI